MLVSCNSSTCFVGVTISFALGRGVGNLSSSCKAPRAILLNPLAAYTWPTQSLHLPTPGQPPSQVPQHRASTCLHLTNHLVRFPTREPPPATPGRKPLLNWRWSDLVLVLVPTCRHSFNKRRHAAAPRQDTTYTPINSSALITC